jgi:hypothetical protein
MEIEGFRHMVTGVEQRNGGSRNGQGGSRNKEWVEVVAGG